MKLPKSKNQMSINEELKAYRKLGTPSEINSILECLLKTDTSNLIRIQHNIKSGSQKEKVLNSLINGKVENKLIHNIMESISEDGSTPVGHQETEEPASTVYHLDADPIVSEWDEDQVSNALSEGVLEVGDKIVNFYEEDGKYFFSADSREALESLMEEYGYSPEDYGHEISEAEETVHPEEPDETEINPDLENVQSPAEETEVGVKNQVAESNKITKVNESKVNKPSSQRYKTINENKPSNTNTNTNNSLLRKLFGAN